MSATVLPTRIQIMLNGRRYEADPTVVVANFNFFAHFYASDASSAAADACSLHAPRGFKFRREMSTNCNDPAAPATISASCLDATSYRTQLSSCAPSPPEGAVPADAISAKDIFDFGAVPSIAADFFGPILVAARKGRLTPSPFIWDDYNYSEQEAIAFVVRLFGVAALAAQGQSVVTAEAVPLTVVAASATAAPSATSAHEGGHNDDSCDEEGMPRLNVGCSRCGTQAHSDATCPYIAGVPGVTIAEVAPAEEAAEGGASTDATSGPVVSDEAARLAAQTMGIAFGIPRAAMEAVARLGTHGLGVEVSN